MVSDKIEKEIVIPAPPERVWAILTEGRHVGSWFGNGQPTRIDLRPGGRIVFDHGNHGDIPADIDTVERPHVLSYRWAVIGPAGEQPRPGNSTLVELRIESADGETTLHLTESGFNAVETTVEELKDRYKTNDAGWVKTLQDLRNYVVGLDSSSEA